MDDVSLRMPGARSGGVSRATGRAIGRGWLAAARGVFVLVLVSCGVAACDGGGGKEASGGGGAGGSGGNVGAGGAGGTGAGTTSMGSGGVGAGGAGVGGDGGAAPVVALTEAHCPGGAPSVPAGSVVVFGGGGTSGRTSVTTDGASWADVTTASLGPQFEGHSRNLIRGVGYGAGVFVAVGGLDNAYVVTSCDGEHYRQDVLGTNVEGDVPEPYRDFLSAVAYGNGVFAAVGGGGKKVISKDHGLTWQAVGGGESGHLRAVARGDEEFVATGHLWEGDVAMVTTSTDGETWTPTATSEGELGRGVVFGNGKYVAIGTKRCAVSADGVSWSDCGIGGGADQLGVHFVGGKFHVQRADGTVRSTVNVDTWETLDGWLPDAIAQGEQRLLMARWGARGWSEGSLFDWTTTSYPVEEGLSDLVAGKVTFAP